MADTVRAAFLQRPDIAGLPPAEQEAAWQAHLPKVQAFMAALAHCEWIAWDLGLSYNTEVPDDGVTG